MEAGTAPRAAPGVSGLASPRLLRVASDERLVALVREGKGAAFEAAYDRHHRAILSFCRHMLGSLEEAEDAVQHTFLAAYNDLISSHKPIHLRAWLFTIARNRCYSILRARREQPLGELDEPTTEGLATQVQRRQDLRDLVGDLRRLPDEQRAALVLSEIDSLTHGQIADVLGVPKDKVKALVFQARESLVASRAARETDCAAIREQLANLHGGALRRANLRRHLHECTGCRDFRQEVERQRRQLRVLLPVAPTLALKEAVLAATVGGGATITAAGGSGSVFAGSLLKGGVVKGLLGAALAGVGTAGTIVAVHDFQLGVGSGFRFGGSHQLTSRAPFTPAAPDARVDPRKGLSSTSSYRSTPASRSAGAVSSYAASGGGASAHSSTGGSAATMIAVLHPLSPKGLTSTLIPSPLLPLAVSGAGSASTGHAVHTPKASSTSPIPPYLAPSAFGSGDQGSTGGTRSTSSNHDGAPSTSSSGAATTQTYPSSTGVSGQAQGGSSHSGYSVSAGGNSGDSSHASAPTSSGSSGAGTSATSKGPSGPSSWASGSGGSRGGASSGSSGSGSAGSASNATGAGSGSGSSVVGSAGSGAGSSGSGASGTGSGSPSTGASDGSGYGGGSNTAPHGR